MIKWRVTINGEEVNLEGLDLSLYISTTYQPRRAIAFTVAGNEITATYKGAEQKVTGVYRLTLYRNEGENAQSILDACDAFELVSCSCLTVDAAFDGAEVELPVADLGVGIPGLSAYEIAVSEGFVGTQAEWIASLSAASEAAAAECREVIAEFSQAEDSRVTAEAQRVANENNRIAGEGSRVEAENDRAAAEQLRVAAESKRDAAELARISNENNRADAEGARSSAEAIRVANENTRLADEETRMQNEAARVTAESKRANAEAQRETAETDRRAAELVRIENETARHTAEQDRMNAEANRVHAENLRKTAEDARIANEATRQTYEQARVTAETNRETAETNRTDAEAARVEAEAARAEEFAGFTATLAAKEDKANKVTSINADADDVHYPSAKAVKDSLAKVKNIEVTPDMLSESTKQLINSSGGGTIANFADDEDLTTVDNALKLADKTYDPITYSGMGRKYLRKNLVDGKNILTQAMLTSANTIYIIQYDYDLNGATITIPENCTLDFQGGSLVNGTVKLQDTYIQGKAKILTKIANGSTCLNEHLNILWFGAVSGDKSIDTGAIITKLGNVNVNTIIIPEGTFYSKSFKLPAFKYLKGNGCSKSILKAVDNGLSYSYSGVQIDEIFIAIYQPGNRITDITIDGSYDEEKRNVCVGLYQAGFSFKLERCKMINAIGCVWMRCIGGYISFTDNLFYTGIDFCLKLEYHIDHAQILRNNFEGFETLGEDGVIIINPDSNSGGICKSLLLAENRFESVKSNIIYNFINAGYFLNVRHNIYLLPTLDENAILYRFMKQASAARFTDETFQSVGKLSHYYIINKDTNVNNVIIDNAISDLRGEWIGYFDEQGEYKTWYTVGEKPVVNIKIKEKNYWLPLTNTLESSCELNFNTVINKLHFRNEGAYGIIRGWGAANYLVLQSNQLYVCKNDTEKMGNICNITWLCNKISGTSNERPTTDLYAGNSYYDTTLGKPIWWTGSAWVDATGATV